MVSIFRKLIVIHSALTLLVFLGSCSTRSEPEPSDGPWQAAIDTLGNTVSVRTLQGSVWGGVAELVETASIGAAQGPEYYLFGDVRGLTADSEHIYVLDWQVSMIRVYDHAGAFIRNIGRPGSGPGEFRDPIAIGVHEEGNRLFVRERAGGLVHAFVLAGEYLETIRVPLGGNYSALTKMLRVSDEGDLYLFSTLFTPDSRTPDRVHSRYVMLGTHPDGAVFDTLNVPWYDYGVLQLQGTALAPRITVPFSPNKYWNLSPSGAMIGGVSDSYTFEIRHADGRLLRIARQTPPVPVDPGESRWHYDTLTDRLRRTDPGWIWRGPSIPEHKPAFDAFIPDWSGRIWVVRRGPGVSPNGTQEWRDTCLLDVFEEQTGRYLGEVRVPPGLRFEPEPCIRDDLFIAYCQDREGVPYIRSFRIQLPD